MKISEVQQELSAVSAIDRECRAESRAAASGIKRLKATNASSPAGLARTGLSADDKQKRYAGQGKACSFVFACPMDITFRRRIRSSVRKAVQMLRLSNAS